jgi:hypothetical protein
VFSRWVPHPFPSFGKGWEQKLDADPFVPWLLFAFQDLIQSAASAVAFVFRPELFVPIGAIRGCLCITGNLKLET